MMEKQEKREIELERLERLKHENKRAAKNLQKSIKKREKHQNKKKQKTITSKSPYRTSIQNRTKTILKSKRQKITSLKQEMITKKESEELKECTFKPKINKQSKKRKSRGVEALYEWKKTINEKIFERENEILKDITHKPKINRASSIISKGLDEKNLKVEERLLKHIETKNKKIEKKREDLLKGLFEPKINETTRESKIANNSETCCSTPRMKSARGVSNNNSGFFNKKASRYFSKKISNNFESKKNFGKSRSKSSISEIVRSPLGLKKHNSDDIRDNSGVPVFVKSDSNKQEKVTPVKRNQRKREKRKKDKNVKLANNALKALDNLLKEKTSHLMNKDDEFSRLEKQCEEEFLDLKKENFDLNGKINGKFEEDFEDLEEVLKKIEAKCFEKGKFALKT